MMDWTDRHCRAFHRLLTREALLYTEMVTTGAILHGDTARFLRCDPSEQPVALQLGGSEPEALARCAALGEQYGYVEINLNCGCPSDRVQEGRFGACLMKEPERVAACVAAMRRATSLPVTVKHRMGVDDLEGEAFLHHFVATVAAAGCETFIVHARKAWLQGLSPRQNREIPPLDYAGVYRLKQAYPQLRIVLNGGVRSLDECETHLRHVDGVMLGREAYENPYLLAGADARLFGSPRAAPTREAVLADLRPHIERNLAEGRRLSDVSRHVLGLYRGMPGGRAFRRVLSEQAVRPGADYRVIEAALDEVRRARLATAA
jgi:tRNA-dihydrouridine synthase A